MSFLKPRTLFAVEDDGLIQRLDFSDEEDGFTPPDCDISPVERNNLSPSDDDQLDSSTDSAISELTSTAKKPARISDADQDVNMTSPTKFDRSIVDGSTPPYRKVRALRLFESPQSPKTLLKQSELSTVEAQKRTLSRLQTINQDHNKLNGSFNRNRGVRPPRTPIIEANINPFTQTGMYLCSKTKKRRLNGFIGITLNNSLDEIVNENENNLGLSKHFSFGEITNSRYENEFYEVCQIGSGEFGSVFRCINRLDGCEYAIKKLRKPLKGSSDERRALNEVYAHAVLGQHTHVVRYYSAWAENDHMLIQNEYCNGGSLADAIEEKKKEGVMFSETNVKQILLHIALGLRYIHSLNLAHMDIKPGNIFITTKPKLFTEALRFGDSSDDGFEDEIKEEEIVYKIGDLALVTSILNPEVEEGDCRYLPAELLKDDYNHLPKADIFALGLTIYEVCGGSPLPKNGTEWHSIREGNLPYLANYSKDLNMLLKQMIHPNPELRPTSIALVQNKTLVPYTCKTKAQLNKELNAEKFKNQLLSRQLAKASQSLKKEPKKSIKDGRISRIIGGKYNRSNSVTIF